MRSETQTDPTYGYTAHLPPCHLRRTVASKAKLNLAFRRYVILGACNPRRLA